VALQQRYQELFENANDVVFTCRLNGHLTSLNKAGQRIIGYSLPEAIGKDLTRMAAPEHAALVEQMIQHDDAPEAPRTHEPEIATQDRRRVPQEIRVRLVRDEGLPVAIQGLARDITDPQQPQGKGGDRRTVCNQAGMGV